MKFVEMGARSLLKSSAIYGMLNFLPLASRFFLFPIFVNFLTPYDYGLLGLHATVASLMTIIISGGLDSAFSRFFFDFEKDIRTLRSYLSTIIIAIFSIGAVLGSILLFCGQPIYTLVFEDSNYTFFPYGVYAFLFALGASVNAIILLYYRNKEQPTRYLAFSAGMFLLMISLEMLAVFYLDAGADQVLIARLIGLFVPSIFVWISFLLKGVDFRIDYLKSSLKYAKPVFLYLLLGFLYLHFDRVLVSNLLSIDQLGIYSVAITIASILEISLQAIDMAILPTIYKWYKNSELVKINRLYRYSGFVSLMLVGIIIGFTPIFILRFTPEFYNEAIFLIPIFLIGYLGRFYQNVLNKPLYYFKKVNQLPWVNAVAGVVLIGCDLILIDKIGLKGAAVGMVVSRCIMIPILIYLAKKHTDILPKLGIIHVLFLLTTGLMLFCISIPHWWGVLYISYYFSSFILFFIILLIMFVNRSYLKGLLVN